MGAHPIALQRDNTGATAVPRLTDLALKNVRLPERGHVTLWDKPLGCRVSRTGVKTFIVILHSGRRQKIGRYGDITLAQARDAAQRLKAEKTLGRILPRPKSLADARKEYLAQLDVRKSTRAYYERNLNRLKATKLSDITSADIRRIVDKLSRSSREQALASFRAFFKWCRPHLERSPCEGMSVGKSTKRSRVLSNEELQSIWGATAERSHFSTIVRLIILTGMRKSEVAGLKSDYVKDDLCTLPEFLCKNKRENTFPLCILARSLIPSSRDSISGLIFPARGNSARPFSGWSKCKAALDAELKTALWQLRDLRRTYRTIHARIGTPPHIAERLICHISSTSELEEIYDRHTYLPEMRDAVAKYEAYLTALLANKSVSTARAA
jgi:integrase